MQEFLLILKGDGMNKLSPDELQAIMTQYKNWVNELGDHYLGGQRLDESGTFLKDKKSEVITDGPFLESKEIIAGYMLIQAKNLDKATDIAKRLPHLGLYRVEVRPITFPKMK